MKLWLEKIVPVDNLSRVMMNRELDVSIPFEWHHHREYELTLTLNSQGQRFIGDHIGGYKDGDLVLLGPNLPHTWQSNAKMNQQLPHHAIVMWFDHEWVMNLVKIMPELKGLAGLLTRSSRAVKFSNQMSDELRLDILSLVNQSAAEKTLSFLAILQRLTTDKQSCSLASEVYASQLTPQIMSVRIDRVLQYMHQNYTDDLKVADLANISALSVSGFHRMFLRYTNHRPTDYIIRLRIGKACSLLLKSDRAIAHISHDVGFKSLVNFNRQFKRQKHLTPREFRAKITAA